ncbi:fatty acid desaturase [Tropicimonas sp.]|uniref:fatty acid desaturase n=1 Tax=Tropicimonas sp. TaxID=2067044 RepID=UPI003A88BDCC
MAKQRYGFEWPTLVLLVACYALWGIGLTLGTGAWLPLGIVLVALAGAQHSSLQHEIIHYHPFRDERLNELLVSPALTLAIPYGRFRDTHRAHHTDENLTDPYDDPESNYMDPRVWYNLPGWVRSVLLLNNTLLGRMLIGPVVGQIAFMGSDWRAIRTGDRSVLVSWLLHIPAVLIVIWLVSLSPMPFWAYLVAAYAALAILKIRTFLEHRAFPDYKGRTVIVEDRGPLALLFLNNNLHVVHHAHPGVPWYALPGLFRERRDAFLERNYGYRYASYGEVFSRYLLRRKDPVPHPLMPSPLDAAAGAGSMAATDQEHDNAAGSDHGNRGIHPF